MAGAGFQLQLEGADLALKALDVMAGRLAHPEPLFDLVGAMLVTSTQQRFERETDPDGNPWPPSLRVQLSGGKTLTDTAALRNSITHEPSDAGVAVGTNDIKAGPHQFGAVIRPVSARALAFEIGGEAVFAKSVTIPQRAFLGLDDDDEAAIVLLAEDFVLAPAEGADHAG